MTVYGRHQAAVHVDVGWQLMDSSVTVPSPPSPAVEATDAAATLADESGIDLATVKGTGANGRITVNDVRALVNGD